MYKRIFHIQSDFLFLTFICSIIIKRIEHNHQMKGAYMCFIRLIYIERKNVRIVQPLR